MTEWVWFKQEDSDDRDRWREYTVINDTQGWWENKKWVIMIEMTGGDILKGVKYHHKDIWVWIIIEEWNDECKISRIKR